MDGRIDGQFELLCILATNRKPEPGDKICPMLPTLSLPHLSPKVPFFSGTALPTLFHPRSLIFFLHEMVFPRLPPTPPVHTHPRYLHTQAHTLTHTPLLMNNGHFLPSVSLILLLHIRSSHKLT